MTIKLPFFHQGILCFHLKLITSANGKNGLETVIPNKLIEDVSPMFFLNLETSYHLSELEVVKLLKKLGAEIQESNKAEFFYYDDSLLVDNEISEGTLHVVFDKLDGVKFKSGLHFSSTTRSIEFYALSVRFMESYLFSRKKHNRLIEEIKISSFETKLSRTRLRTEYVDRWNISNKTITLESEGSSVYVLLDNKNKPLMILID